ncbi:hypothetical protein HKBW3S33_01640, partial [Candidatus Hakubella thermalkaliphila]
QEPQPELHKQQHGTQLMDDEPTKGEELICGPAELISHDWTRRLSLEWADSLRLAWYHFSTNILP